MAAKYIGNRNISEILMMLENGSNRGVLTQESIHLLSCIPEGYIPLPHQIAGHRHTNGKDGTNKLMALWIIIDLSLLRVVEIFR